MSKAVQIFLQLVGFGLLAVMSLGVFLRGFKDRGYWIAGGIAWALILAAVGVGTLLGRLVSPPGEKKPEHEVLRELARMTELTQKMQAGQATEEERQELERLIARPLGR